MKAKVYILGRYRKTAESVTEALNRSWENLDVEFSTIHAAKGKEAEYIVIVGMTRGGFPSTIQDDPLLALAMPRGDEFPHAEERRLFYVALTRSRRAVLLMTVTRRESPFLLELINHRHVNLETSDGQIDNPIICPECKVNRMVRREGRYGEFYGCSAFPSCRGTKQIAAKPGSMVSGGVDGRGGRGRTF